MGSTVWYLNNVGIGTTAPAAKLHVLGTTYLQGNLRVTSGGYIDDDGTFGGNGDDWLRFNGYIEFKSNTDSYGIVLRDKDGSNYLGMTQVGGDSYFSDSNNYANYFLKGSGRNAVVGDHMYGKSVNGAYSHLYRFGGLFLTWDSDSYGTNSSHSIRSTYGDTYGDEITINSYNHLRINLDANNNDSNSYFEIGQHTTHTSNILFRVVSPTGNVGIGNTSPAYKLDVSGDIRANNGWIRSTGDYGIYNNSDATYFYSDDGNYWRSRSDRGIKIANKSNTIKGYLYHDNSNSFGLLDGDGNWAVRVFRDNYNSFHVNNSEKMRILSSGNIGIGTTTPGYKLDVNGTINATQLLVNGQAVSTSGPVWTLSGSDASFNSGKIAIGTSTPPTDKLLQLDGTTTSTGLSLSNSGLGAAHLYWDEANRNLSILGSRSGGANMKFTVRDGSNNYSDALYIKNDGNIGIGTTTPQSKLAVDGIITSKEVNVTATGWPDYVFESDYELMSLEEIETFISEKGHLPEIPSAQEVEENGLSLGEMNAMLLKKIEELTLHVIRQQKEINSLKKK